MLKIVLKILLYHFLLQFVYRELKSRVFTLPVKELEAIFER